MILHLKILNFQKEDFCTVKDFLVKEIVLTILNIKSDIVLNAII